MSDVSGDYLERLNLREQIARIDRSQAEMQKLLAEGAKLLAERDKFTREPWILVLAGMITGLAAILAAIVARLPEILHAFGV